jgi:hypothetical protein
MIRLGTPETETPEPRAAHLNPFYSSAFVNVRDLYLFYRDESEIEIYEGERTK